MMTWKPNVKDAVVHLVENFDSRIMTTIIVLCSRVGIAAAENYVDPKLIPTCLRCLSLSGVSPKIIGSSR